MTLVRPRDTVPLTSAAPPLSLLASYPPPFGGVANHVQRLSALLDARQLEHVVYNAVSESTDRRVVSVSRHRHSWMVRYAFTARERAVYIFSARLEVWLLGAWMARYRGKRIIVRLRNVALHEYLANPKTRPLARFALQRATRVIAVSRELANAALAAGVAQDRVLHQPGFLPPPPTTDSDLAPEQRAFLAGHRPIIAANGRVDFHKGTDLYGLDHMVEMIGRLRTTYPEIGLTVSFWDHQSQDEPHLARLKRRAAELNVSGNVQFFTQSRPFVPVLARADVFVRPTCTDGDANSIREALYLGVPAVASDVVERPKGTVLHRVRELEHLIEQVESMLRHPKPRAPNPAAFDMAGVDRYVDMLAELSRP